MLICDNCGRTYEDYELKPVLSYDDHGRLMPNEASDSCPHCKWGDIVEAVKCPVCDRWFSPNSFDGICEDCLREAETVKIALEIGDANRENVEINGFIASALSADRINHILEEYIRMVVRDRDAAVTEYLRDDKDYFISWVEKIAKKVK